MAGQDLVRPSRDGDQFHYHWAARQCLGLLSDASDLIAVTIEGPSVLEGNEVAAGEELIDVGLYYGAEARAKAKLIRYIQLKHSTRRGAEPWMTSGLEKTIRGFAARYQELIKQFSVDDVARRFRFEFTSNRPILPTLQEALQDLESGAGPRHLKMHEMLLHYTDLGELQAAQFFALFSAEGQEENLWSQRNLLVQDVSSYLPDVDYEAPVQLKELITRKATAEFESNPTINRHDVLRALKATETQLQPAPCLIQDGNDHLAREQELDILQKLLAAEAPIIIHADGGVGKSVLAARLARSMPNGSQAVVYDCFGDGLYRTTLGLRHRHQDAFVQIANELAVRGLCHPLIPSSRADLKAYARAFLYRLAQAIRLLRAHHSEASLCIIIDAADNAEMAARELGEPSSFVRDLIRAPLPQGVRLALTSRTHRRDYLHAPPNACQIELRGFTISESAGHLRRCHPSATDADVAEFAMLSSSNPRLQALALSRRLPLQDMLRQLGPTPTTVDRAIGELLEQAVAQLKDQEGSIEASQIDVICQGLAVLRPLVPITLLAKLAGTSESAVRSFALGLGRPLLVKGDSLHFLDEPAETWFREHYRPDAAALSKFLDHLRPLTLGSSYAAGMLPQLLLLAGKLDELVQLALSDEALPTENPLAERDVKLQRLTFALRACLQQHRHAAAVKLALKAAGECAGEQRQNRLIQSNTDLAAVLMTPDRIEEIVSRRTFGSGWMGSHHAYDAGFLSGRAELHVEASSRLRMAMEWLRTWSRRSHDEREDELVSDEDRSELSIALLRLQGPQAAAEFLRRWSPRHLALQAGEYLARRLLDLGHFDQLDSLADAAGNDIWLLLGLVAEADAVRHTLPARPLARLLRLLADRRVKLEEAQRWDARASLYPAIAATIGMALRVLTPEPLRWAAILRKYLPASPPFQLASRFGFDRAPILRAYSLEAALRGQQLTLIDVAPTEVRKHLESSDRSRHDEDTDIFREEVGRILPWFILDAEIACGRRPLTLTAHLQAALNTSFTTTSLGYFSEDFGIRQTVARQWFRILRNLDAESSPEREMFISWLDSLQDPLWLNTLLSLCRASARLEGFESLAINFASNSYKALENSREDAETRAASYLQLARAIVFLNKEDASAYFDRAVEIVSRIGDENLNRWAAFLHLATAAAERKAPKPQTAYRLSRVAELTYEYVVRDKHFDWDGTVAALSDLCACSALAILSRWRDRRFGYSGRLLPEVLYRLMHQGQLPVTTAVAFAGVRAEWDRLADLVRAVEMETDTARRAVAARIAYRYMRVEPYSKETWIQIRELGAIDQFEFRDIDRLISTSCKNATKETLTADAISLEQGSRSPDWQAIFQDIDLANADALHAAYEATRAYGPPYIFADFFRQAIARVRTGRESELIRALAAWPSFGVFDLRGVIDGLPEPMPTQPSFRNSLRDIVLSTCRREPMRVRRKGWSAIIPFQKLIREGILSDNDVVSATLEGFAAQMDTLTSGELFQMVDPLASCLSPAEADEALNFGLDTVDDLLRPDDGDGPWKPELHSGGTLVSAVAGYIWVGLGSPIVAERWQWAHVVRSLVELDWTDLLDSLIDRAENDDRGPFVDQRLEFYVWHARQWLLIGLGRGGMENPAALRVAKPLLLRWLSVEHVLIRAFAAQALRSLHSTGELTASELVGLANVNRPSLPEKIYAEWGKRDWEEDVAIEAGLTDNEKYYFGIDIGPYWFEPLGRAFGLTENAIERRARDVLRRHMGRKGGSRHDDGRHTRKVFDGRETWHSHGSLPKTDDLQAYQAYHAMMFVASLLLTDCHVRRHAEQDRNEFEDWIADRLLTRGDGCWLADRRDPCLVAIPPPSDGYNDKLWRWSVTKAYLDKQLASDDGMTVLWGYWTGGDDHTETVSVHSALVSHAGAEALVAALQFAPELGRFALPNEGEREDLQNGALKLLGWVSTRDRPGGLDRSDPWAEGLQYPGPVPSEQVIATLGLSVSTDGRTWLTDDGGKLRSETWTRIRRLGREVESMPGWRLSSDRHFLRRLFETYPDYRLVLSVEVIRRPPSSRNNHDEDAYAGPYSRYFLMGDDCVTHAF